MGTNLLAAARELGVDLDSVCGGRGICGRCKTLVHEGEFAAEGIRSAADHLSPISEPEKRYAERRELATGQRLSCHATIQADCVIDVPPESQLHRQVIRKDHQQQDIELDPVLRLHYVEVEEPRLAAALLRLCPRIGGVGAPLGTRLAVRKARERAAQIRLKVHGGHRGAHRATHGHPAPKTYHPGESLWAVFTSKSHLGPFF